MTPAINLLKKKKIFHTVRQYQHDPNCKNYGMEAAEQLNMDPKQVFKTLLFSVNGEPKNLAVAIIPVDAKLNLKQAAKAMKSKKAEMADPDIAQKTTGYIVGGISPIGQKKALPTFVDVTAQDQGTVLVSGGKRGLDIELSPKDLAGLTRGAFVQLTDVS